MRERVVRPRYFYIIIVVVFLIIASQMIWKSITESTVGQQTAAIIFTAATVQIGIIITIIRPVWKAFHWLSISPIQNKTETSKIVWFRLIWGTGIIILGFSLSLNFLTLFCIGDTMLGINFFSYEEVLYKLGVICVLWGTSFFVIGLCCSFFPYAWDGISFMWGKSTVLFTKNKTKEQSLTSQKSDSKGQLGHGDSDITISE